MENPKFLFPLLSSIILFSTFSLVILINKFWFDSLSSVILLCIGNGILLFGKFPSMNLPSEPYFGNTG